MIVFRLFGNLGNQLFQYATSYSFSQKLGVSVKYDPVWFFRNRKIGRLTLKKIVEVDTFGILWNPRLIKVFNLILFWKTKKITLMKEVKLGFDSGILNNLVDKAYYDGYWGSFRYFNDCREDLKFNIMRGRPNTPSYLKKESILRDCELSIGIHVRRGDYVKNHSESFGVLDEAFYDRGTQEILKRTQGKNYKFFVFSNDAEWCRNTFRDLNPVFFFSNGSVSDQDIEDFFLMIECDMLLIANSTFSWWAAYLSNSDNIFYPTPFTKAEISRINDVIPEWWIPVSASFY